MLINRWFKLTTAVAVLLAIAFSSHMAIAQGTQRTVNITFDNGIQSSRALADVFVESEGGSPDQVVRLDAAGAKDPANLAKMLYASTVPVDPGSKSMGPFPKGAALGVTLQQWLAATGTGTYTVNGTSADLNVSFKNLVPNGTYTLWCVIDSSVPSISPDLLPCGASDGSQNVFKADPQGNGTFKLTMKRLPETTQERPVVIAPSYHNDGKTHGANPGDFGLNSHVQLTFMIPLPSPQTLPNTGDAGDWGWAIWIVMLAGVVLVVGGWIVRKTLRRA